MKNRNTKFIVGSLIIIAVLIWLGMTGFEEGKSYYMTIAELRAQDKPVHHLRLRLAGNVVPGSLKRREGEVHFAIHQEEDQIPVRYIGTEPLPDTLTDDAQAVVTGQYTRENIFVAEQVQAKCASKYEALPPGMTMDTPQTNSSAY